MKIQQLSIFIENEPGHLLAPCKALADAGVNILTLSLSDTREYGIVHFIVDDWQRAKTVLEQGGLVVNVAEVVALEVDDQPGGLARMLAIISEGGLNIEYMYAFTFGCNKKAVLVFRFEDPASAVEHLTKSGVNLFGASELSALCKGDG